jgi:cell division protein FtsW (lipid II flippase)
MSKTLTDGQADRWTGALGLMLSIAYILHARTIEDSLLADDVGVAGVPVGVASVMALTCLILLLKSLKNPMESMYEATGDWASSTHLKAVGLLAILAVYVALLPLLGYIVAIGFLIGSVAWFAGARESKTIFSCMVLAGPFMWFVFDWTLEIRQPMGFWPQWWGANLWTV